MELSALSRARQAWDDWWFAPIDARWLGGMRIALGGMLILNWIQLFPVLDLLLGADGVMDAEVLAGNRTRWAVTVDTLSGADLHLTFWLGLGVLICFTAGLGTRAANLLAALLLVGLWHRNPWMWNGGDRVLRIWTLTMCLAPSGAAWSVDAWVAAKKGRPGSPTVPAVAHRLIVIQLCIMYLGTGIAKLGGPTWWDGTAIYWALGDGGYSRAPALLDPVMQTTAGQVAAALLTWGTLLWELAFVPLVVFRRTRPLALVCGVALHAGILATMSVGMFGPASVWGYLAFFGRVTEPRR